MEFRVFLEGAGIDPGGVALCLHKPGGRIRDAVAMMAETEPDLFDAYQSTHPAIPEATVKARPVMASFLARGNGEQVFLGLYRRDGWTDRPAADLDADPRFRAMQERVGGFRYEDEARRLGIPVQAHRRAQFALSPMVELADLRGRLIVRDPGSRAYMRLAETTPLPVVEILRDPDLSPPMPDWRDLALEAAALRSLPARWADRLRHWRGIYLIADEADGARYVGAAYGEENLLGRWRAHVAREVGVTRELSRRNPATFRFSILELLSPAAGIDEVTRLEQSWMLRLHTRRFGLNA